MLAKSHSSPMAKDRKTEAIITRFGDNTVHSPNNDKIFMESDIVVDKVYADIAMGKGKSAIIKKIMGGEYGKNPVKRRQASYIYNAALDRFAIDRDEDAERLRNILYGRYEAVLEEAMRKGDLYNARCVLDSIARVFLGSERNVVNIQNNADKLVVTFGFKGREKDEEVKAEETEYEEVE